MSLKALQNVEVAVQNAIIDSQNICDISMLEIYHLSFITSQSYPQK